MVEYENLYFWWKTKFQKIWRKEPINRFRIPTLTVFLSKTNSLFHATASHRKFMSKFQTLFWNNSKEAPKMRGSFASPFRNDSNSQKEESTSRSPTPSVRVQGDEHKYNNEFPPLPKCLAPLSAGFSSKLRLIFHASITILFLFNYTCFMVYKTWLFFFFFFFFIALDIQVYQRVHWQKPKR